MAEKKPESIPVDFDDGIKSGRASFKAPKGLRSAMDDLITSIQLHTSVRFSRNELILKSIHYYMSYLMTLPNLQSQLKAIQDSKVD